MNKSQCVRVTWVVMFALLGLATVMGGCGGTEAGNPGAGPTFADDGALESYIKEQYASAVTPAPGTTYYPTAPGGTGDQTSTEGDQAASNFSGTNVQEAGVDESDKVKTDGQYLYVAQDRAVPIVRLGDGGAMDAVATVPVGGTVDSLYLYGGHLVVLYHPAGDQPIDWCAAIDPIFVGGGALSALPCWIPSRAKTGVLIVDIATPSKPTVVRDLVFDGGLVASRRIGAALHLITQFFPNLPPLEPFYDPAVESQAAVVARNRQALAGVHLDDLVPAFASRDGAGELVGSGRLIATDNFLRPDGAQGGSVTTVTTLDLNHPETPPISVAALLDAHRVYASTAALYLAGEHFAWGAATTTFYATATTTIYKYDLSGGGATFAGSGTVSGTALDQYSFGEYQGVLRLATSTGESWDGSARTHVFCLRQGGDGLEIVGRLDDLAPGERLYAARFLGPRGFLVTFVNIDPLFTLDLSDPAHPQAVGELKVPGYSDYIHPVGENYLLTIGKDAVRDGSFAWYQGLQLSLFDVSDLAHPQLLHVAKIGDRGTESLALHDPKAFTFWAEHDLLAVPVDLYQYTTPPQLPSEYGSYVFSGLYVYRVTADSGFVFLGRISTTGEAGPSSPSYGIWARGLFVGPTVYAATPDAVRSAEIDDVANTVQTLDLTQ